MKFNKTERETIFLLVVKKMIDDMVNFEMIELLGQSTVAEIRFKSMTHQKFFNIILVDFLSCPDDKIIGRQQPYLRELMSIYQKPSFNQDNSVDRLKESTKCFRKWLNKQFVVKKIWLPSIALETNLKIKRIEFIKICGNISKHNFTRLSGVVNDIIAVFKRNNISLKKEETLLILDEFYEWFHTNILSYHSSAIAEFLNNIRWSIFLYLRPEFEKSIVYIKDDKFNRYKYTYPKKIKHPFAKECYWNLMNEVRSKPYINVFQVTKYLKMRY